MVKHESSSQYKGNKLQIIISLNEKLEIGERMKTVCAMRYLYKAE